MDHPHSTPRPFARLWQLFRPEKRDLWMIVFFALFVSLLSLVIPIGVEALVSTVTFGVAVWPLIWLAGIMLLCLGLAGLIIAIETWSVELLQRRLFIRVVTDIAWRLPRLPLPRIMEANGPSLLNRYFEVMTIQKAFSTLVLDGTRLAITILVGLVVLAFYHPYLFIFSLGLILFLFILMALGWGGVQSQIDESAVKYEMADWLSDVASNPRIFKTGRGPDFALDRAERIALEYIDRRSTHFRVVFRQIVFALFLYVASSVLLLGLGGYLVISQQLTIGQLVAAELIVALVVGSFAKLGKYLDAWYDICTGVEKLAHITDLQVERDDGIALPASGDGMKLTFSGFGLSQRLIVKAGTRLAIEANRPRADELLESLAGLRECDRGLIEVDGYDIVDLQLVELRKSVAYVASAELFTATLYDNLTVGHSFDGDVVRESLQIVGLTERVNAMPAGMNTSLQTNGHPFTPEEALRFCIARAMLARPRLMILDGVLDRIDLEQCPELLGRLTGNDWPGTLVVVTGKQWVSAPWGQTLTRTQ